MRCPLTIYSARFVQPGFAATTRGPVIFVRPEYRNDRGLLEHERVHVRQWLRTLGMHSLLYALSKDYRLGAEVEAYREQARHYPDDRRPMFARAIAEKYGLDISPDAALKRLQQS